MIVRRSLPSTAIPAVPTAGLGSSGATPQRVQTADLHPLPGCARCVDPPGTLQAQEVARIRGVHLVTALLRPVNPEGSLSYREPAAPSQV